MYLSKTSILAGLNCAKHLYLMLKHPELAIAKESPLAEAGIAVGKKAREEFSNGVLVNRFQRDEDAFAESRKFLDDESTAAIFEAGFRFQDTEVFVDILQRAESGWNLIEVKSATSVKDDYIDDAAIQYHVLTSAGIVINRVELMHLNRDFEYRGNGDYRGLFIRQDITERVTAHVSFIRDEIVHIRRAISNGEPVRHVAGHCKTPYVCEFKSWCEKQDGEYPVGWLPNAAVVIRQLHDNGIYDIRDIPVEMLNSETHLKVRRVTIQGQPELDPDAAEILQALSYPRYYLDFESINFAIPIWPGTRPTQQHPFQWSCHVQTNDGKITHMEFLDVSGNDPRREFAESLIHACGSQGTVIVYNQTFEKGIIKNLAAAYDDLSEALLAINRRVFDLLPVMKQYYYHPAMKGSWSIKSVLTCLLPELRYSDLGEVQDGLMAQSAYLQIINGKLTKEKREALTADMRAYCKLDTYAMLAIVEKVCNR